MIRATPFQDELPNNPTRPLSNHPPDDLIRQSTLEAIRFNRWKARLAGDRISEREWNQLHMRYTQCSLYRPKDHTPNDFPCRSLLCPGCMRMRAQRYRDRTMRCLEEFAGSGGLGTVAHLTLTQADANYDRLAHASTSLRGRLIKLRRRKTWRDGCDGALISYHLEYSGGYRASWHVHAHALVTVPGPEEAALRWGEGVIDDWLDLDPDATRSAQRFSLLAPTPLFVAGAPTVLEQASKVANYIVKVPHPAFYEGSDKKYYMRPLNQVAKALDEFHWDRGNGNLLSPSGVFRGWSASKLAQQG